ncbi:MAG TPA: hypothetical protein VH372_25945, partial [Actinospica sp.]|nr:hypothetical protein [Actinospica sp.]
MTYTPPQPVKLQTGRGRKYRRTAGDIGRAVGALLLLLLLLGAIPFALVRFVGWPLPHQLPTMDSLRQPLDSGTLVKALAVVVWLAWAQFSACVIVELANARRGVGIPAKVPVAGPSQFLARQLVAALLMLTATAASFAPDISHLAQPSAAALPKSQTSAALQLSAADVRSGTGGAALTRRTPGASGVNLPSIRTGQQLVSPASTALTSVSVDSTAGTKLYRVQPPHGRSYDSLWEIAERHLGDGRRYKEIYALNKDRVQPDGAKLTDASLIRPGWILEMPADATGGDLIAETPAASADTTVTGSSAAVDPNAATTTSTVADPNAATTVAGATGTTGTTGGSQGAQGTQGSQGAQSGGAPSSGRPTGYSKLTPANPQGVKVSQAAEELAQAVAAAARAAEATEKAQQGGPAGGGSITSAGVQRTSHRGSASADERQLGPVEERVLYGIAG